LLKANKKEEKMATEDTVKISLAKIISLEIVCSGKYVAEIITRFGTYFSESIDGALGTHHLKPFDHCVRYIKRFTKEQRIEEEFHVIVSFPDNNESIRAYIGFISYLRETKKIPIECPSPNELFGE
jgi:hypothetical protein